MKWVFSAIVVTGLGLGFVTNAATASVAGSAATKPVIQQSPKPSQYPFFQSIEIWLLVMCCCGFSTGLFLYKIHATRRATVLQQQVEHLERVWKMKFSAR